MMSRIGNWVDWDIVWIILIAALAITIVYLVDRSHQGEVAINCHSELRMVGRITQEVTICDWVTPTP